MCVDIEVVREFAVAGINVPADMAMKLLERLEAAERERDELRQHNSTMTSQVGYWKAEANSQSRQRVALAEKVADWEREADDLARELSAERFARSAVVRSEQALAAHVERLEAIVPASGISSRPQDVIAKISRVLRDAPENSLSRLISEKQAEAVYRAIVICNSVEATEYLVELRSQSKEPA